MVLGLICNKFNTPMIKQQALQIITEVCNKYVGTLKDHQVIQEALRVLSEEPKKKKKKEEKKKNLK